MAMVAVLRGRMRITFDFVNSIDSEASIVQSDKDSVAVCEDRFDPGFVSWFELDERPSSEC